MVSFLATYLLILIICTGIVFLFRSEHRVYTLSVISGFGLFIISPLLGLIAVLQAIFDYFLYKGVINKAFNFLSSVVLMVAALFLFSGGSLIDLRPNLEFDILYFCCVINLFNRANFYIKNKNFGTIKAVLLFNLFIPRWFTPVISNFFVEVNDIEDELHFSLEMLRSGGKKIIFGVFIILCVVVPGVRLIDNINSEFFCYLLRGLLYLNGIFAVYELGAGSLEIFNYKVYRNFDSPLAPDNLNDFWKRWCLTFYNFSKDLISLSRLKLPAYFSILLCIFIQQVYFLRLLRAERFLTIMVTSVLLFNWLIYRREYLRLLFKSRPLNVFLKVCFVLFITMIFGYSFKIDGLAHSSTEMMTDVGSYLVFFFSCVILSYLHYCKKKDYSFFPIIFKSKSLSVVAFCLYIIMFGDFS